MKEKKVKFSYSDITQKVTTHDTKQLVFRVLAEPTTHISLTREMYTSPENDNEDGFTTVVEADPVIVLAQGFYAWYVYTSIVPLEDCADRREARRSHL